MSITSDELKAIKQAIQSVPNQTTQDALRKMLDLLVSEVNEADTAVGAASAAAYHPLTTAITDGEIDVTATPVLTVENGVITAADAAE